MEQRDILDVIGVGVGPFNLGLAALIDKKIVHINVLNKRMSLIGIQECF